MEPRLMKKFCPRCGRIVEGRCNCQPRVQTKPRKRKPTPNDKTRDEREPWRRAYRTQEYQDARQRAIAASGGRCIDCGRVCAWHDGKKWRTAGMSGEVDHLTPLADGGSNSVTNLGLRCVSCHRKADAKRRKDAGR